MEKPLLLRLGSFEEGYLDKLYDKVDDYRLSKVLGIGSNSRVYLGYHVNSPDRSVAIKFINRCSEYAVEESRQNIVREAQLLKQLDHPNILKVYELVDNGRARTTDGELLPNKILYCVMQLAENGSLEEFLHYSGPFSEELARYYFKQLVGGITYLHERGIAHRDIKAENLLFDEQFNLLIADFGHALHFRDENGELLLSEHCGTPAFNPPEVGKGEYKAEPLDIFLAGVVLFRMMTGGVSPFRQRATSSDPFYRYLHRETPDLDSFWRIQEHNTGVKFGPDLRELLSAMFCYKQEHRITIPDLVRHSWYTKDMLDHGQAREMMQAKKQSLVNEDEAKETNASVTDLSPVSSRDITSPLPQAQGYTPEPTSWRSFLKDARPEAHMAIESISFKRDPPLQFRIGVVFVNNRYSALSAEFHLRVATVVAFNLPGMAEKRVRPNPVLHEVG